MGTPTRSCLPHFRLVRKTLGYSPNFYDYRLKDIDCCGCTSYDYKARIPPDRFSVPPRLTFPHSTLEPDIIAIALKRMWTCTLTLTRGSLRTRRSGQIGSYSYTYTYTYTYTRRSSPIGSCSPIPNLNPNPKQEWSDWFLQPDVKAALNVCGDAGKEAFGGCGAGCVDLPGFDNFDSFSYSGRDVDIHAHHIDACSRPFAPRCVAGAPLLTCP